ncbi:MAG: DUF3524 domain-containing protein [Anaerolineae bacterium]|nr:DUF3524 domain-containing protein [Anaerolineae bacterium]
MNCEQSPLRILLIAPYFGGSHRAWAEGYAHHSSHTVELMTLPARFWKWRIHGAAATLVELLRRRTGPRPDLVLATDMVNLPALLGLARLELTGVPVVLYCHENQLTYPLQPGEKRDLAYPMINWLSMLAADRVLFNSQFHRDSWFGALPNLLKDFPDCSHLPLIPGVRAKARVMPVGVDLGALDREAPDGAMHGTSSCVGSSDDGDSPPLILWNQRWEYDKNPAAFFRALDELAARDLPFRVALAGSNVRQQLEEFEATRVRLGDRVVHFGRADRTTYRHLLWDADIVVSTAFHEFFGIAVVEAIYCRTFPVLPRRLAYPELLHEEARALCLYEDFEGLVAKLIWALTHPAAARETAERLASSVARFDWSKMAPVYDAAMSDVAAS